MRASGVCVPSTSWHGFACWSGAEPARGTDGDASRRGEKGLVLLTWTGTPFTDAVAKARRDPDLASTALKRLEQMPMADRILLRAWTR